MSSEDTVGRCPGCGSSNINTETNLTTAICDECGVVLDDGSFSSAQSMETKAQSASRSQSGNGDAVDQSETAARRWHSDLEVKDSSDERLVGALTQMETMAEELTMTVEACFRAAEILTEAWEQRFMHGRGEDPTVAACIYTACRQRGQPRPISSVADTVGVCDSGLKSIYRTLVTELELQVETAESDDYIPHLSAQLELSHETAMKAEDVLAKAQDVAGNPVGIAAAALYIAANDTENTITFREAAEVSGVTKETIWRKAESLRRN
jgi:transcription initiation factor TFIIB